MDQNINKPAVSIILPVYNAEKYLKQAVESVLAQSFPDFELIIINDGSTDGSQEIIQNFRDPRIKMVRQENKGITATLNVGLSMSHAEYIARIDADDVWSNPNKLSIQMEYLSRNPDCVLLGTWANVIDENDKQISCLKYPETDREIRSGLLTKNCFVHPSVVFRKETALRAGVFNEQEKYVEDYGLWLRMGQYGKFANIPQYLMSYRIHQNSTTQRQNLIQSQNSLALIKKHKAQYPNYFIGCLKWNLKILLLKTIGLKNFNRIK